MSEGAIRHSWTLEAGAFSLHHRGAHIEGVLTGPTHENPGFEVSWIERGSMMFELGRHGTETIRGTSGMSLLLPPDLLNTPHAIGATTVEQILLAPDLLREAADALGSSEARVPSMATVIQQESSISSIARAISMEHALIASQSLDHVDHVHGLHSLATESVDAGMEALVQALTFSLVRTSSTKRTKDERVIEPGIRRALDHINEKHATAAIAVDDLAKTAGLSRFVFLRKFRAQVGESPYRYLTNVRLEHAAQALRTRPRASILEIALDCGFTDQSRFARAFAGRFGTTPQRWRRKLT